MADVEEAFWQALETLAASQPLVVDRPKGSCHPRYPQLIYPLDYGYLAATRSMDGGGIDVWRGSALAPTIDGAIVTVDLVKRDSEIKILIGCCAEEIDAALDFHNNSDLMKAVLIRRR